MFVPGLNEASNGMNRLFSQFTTDSSGFKVGWRCVTCNASHWQDITQLCLTGPRLSCQHAQFASPPPNHTCMYAVYYHDQSSLYFSKHYTVFFFLFSHLCYPSQQTLISFSFLFVGAHFPVNEKWQLCTLFAIQHLPRPPVSQKEGKLHSMTAMSSLVFINLCQSYCISHFCWLCFKILLRSTSTVDMQSEIRYTVELLQLLQSS